MRTWRVGTFSMGASLLFLGIFLLVSRIFGYSLMNIMMAWWPTLLVVLGLEILLFLILTKQEKPYLKYDFLSILFVGLLGTAGIGFAVLSSTGLIEKVEETLSRQEKTLDLPGFSQNVEGEISRVVVETENFPITIEGTTEREISIFGKYRAHLGKNEVLVEDVEDYLSVQKKGDSLYVSIKGLPSETGPFEQYTSLDVTLLVPNDLKLEVAANENEVTMKPRTLQNDWSIDRASSVAVHLQENSDINLSAVGVQELNSTGHEWQVSSPENQESAGDPAKEYTEPNKNGSLKMGEGTHRLNIMNTYSVSLNSLP
ncbi:hypothetical protein CVD25_16045 [Bacillus canaveralius]|uniref:DUF5668 domain-containing protein n=1 Tax=Bacillus canaveralius TaxID=1403243 RepID=A0A2N5GQV7_9BACI|nr:MULTISPECIES: hypothetical protein [Bacillus]PLR85623.1 hypothetical protein CU635_04000 [Bacillus canaveralius]PLR86463.1 hypothetical protein CVD23_06520 [Bacillus sp. V33-4]PLR94716.1 hypothetical protein CVD25_16045 [Bacillus canaveralius]RSK50487.1 hypothetical protein EJA13_14910 [Bacillus canaveralius]